MENNGINMKILLPYKIYADEHGVKQVVAVTAQGSFGLLPHRLDCTAVLAPGILSYTTEQGAVKYVAVDEGILVKAGTDVLISVRKAIGGTDLGELHKQVTDQFMKLNEQEKNVQTVMRSVEAGFIELLEQFRNK
jgi:F-type H+-transporting ATPase subunit epsilon